MRPTPQLKLEHFKFTNPGQNGIERLRSAKIWLQPECSTNPSNTTHLHNPIESSSFRTWRVLIMIRGRVLVFKLQASSWSPLALSKNSFSERTASHASSNGIKFQLNPVHNLTQDHIQLIRVEEHLIDVGIWHRSHNKVIASGWGMLET